jgi:hypothetical protein
VQDLARPAAASLAARAPLAQMSRASLAWALLHLRVDSSLLPRTGTALTDSWMAVSIQVTTMLGTLLIVLLVLLLLGAVPRWSYNRSWGYGPSGLVGVVLLVILILVLSGRL